MERDARRVSSLIRRLSAGGSNSSTAAYKTGVSQLGGGYDVTIGVGTPPQTQTLSIDTGSDLVWVQCKPCDKCYDQIDPVFDPASSTTFFPVPCESEATLLCQRLDERNRGCDRIANQCNYEYWYAEGSHTKGILATESLTMGNTTFPNMPIGCGYKNEGFTLLEDGMLGLGAGFVSFVGGKVGGAFSYCLGGMEGWLEIGRSGFPRNATWVPMISNIKNPGYYYIGLSGLGVGGERVPIPEDTFQINVESGDGGVIIDTGTTATYLPKAAYEPLRDMFRKKTAYLTRAPPKSSVFDTCYYSDVATEWLPKVPDVSFFISGGPILNLTSTNSLIRMNKDVVCFSFSVSHNVAIIGNIQQQGIRITIDGSGGYIGFGPDRCGVS
ncbi:protein aspartic protease in guard cell 2 [Phtheirospermum japonicum]|uniref:Protein aspartic protease in guard cell 2 n=1 Tax=Phtheirospermum japonicum TaxID=374723 RepID=A0A830CWW0_9LAMI|nr:protein aspartic protease in guard cell 2 [Phtheirospermum japonicum]